MTQGTACTKAVGQEARGLGWRGIRVGLRAVGLGRNGEAICWGSDVRGSGLLFCVWEAGPRDGGEQNG